MAREGVSWDPMMNEAAENRVYWWTRVPLIHNRRRSGGCLPVPADLVRG